MCIEMINLIKADLFLLVVIPVVKDQPHDSSQLCKSLKKGFSEILTEHRQFIRKAGFRTNVTISQMAEPSGAFLSITINNCSKQMLWFQKVKVSFNKHLRTALKNYFALSEQSLDLVSLGELW